MSLSAAVAKGFMPDRNLGSQADALRPLSQQCDISRICALLHSLTVVTQVPLVDEEV